MQMKIVTSSGYLQKSVYPSYSGDVKGDSKVIVGRQSWLARDAVGILSWVLHVSIPSSPLFKLLRVWGILSYFRSDGKLQPFNR